VGGQVAHWEASVGRLARYRVRPAPQVPHQHAALGPTDVA
jgi:hypothetical protein